MDPKEIEKLLMKNHNKVSQFDGKKEVRKLLYNLMWVSIFVVTFSMTGIVVIQVIYSQFNIVSVIFLAVFILLIIGMIYLKNIKKGD